MRNEMMDEYSAVVPPQDLELEKAVLGATILESDVLPKIADILKPEMFYKDSHKVIYEALLGLFNKHSKIDLLTVTDQLRKNGELEQAGGVYELTMLISRIASSANTEFHARLLVQKYMQRELIRISSEVRGLAFQDTTDAFELTDATINQLLKLNNIGSQGQIVRVNEVYYDVMDTIHKVRNGDMAAKGIFTHLEGLNNLINGFKAPDLFVLAARPGMGKTAFIISITRSIITSNIPVGIFSLEMSREQLTKRLLSQMSGIVYHKIDQPGLLSDMEERLLSELRNRIDNMPLHIDDSPVINITQLHAKATKMKSEHNIQMIVIDYLQLMSGVSNGRGKSNREAEISEISRGIKQIAKTLDVPVIALSQLNRGVESRPDKRPKLSDLRESGAIEQDADIVGMLFRPSYYGIKDIDGFTPEQVERMGELIIAKHRNGETGTLKVEFIKSTMNYVDFDAGSKVYRF